MSLPTTTFRTLSSPRVQRQLTAKPATLLPFLYQTPTIQQCRSIRTPRHESNSTGTPFDWVNGEKSAGETLPPSIEEVAFHRQRPTTITDTERKAFLKLYNNLGQSASSNAPASQDDAATTSEGSKASPKPLDTIFQNVLQNSVSARDKNVQARAQRSKALSFAKEARSMVPKFDSRTVELNQEDAHRLQGLRKLQEEQYKRITEMLSATKTDTELWDILDREVLTLIRNLDLDGTSATKSKKKPRTKGKKSAETSSTPTIPTEAEPTEVEPTAASLSVIGPNFSSLLVTAVRQLRQEFPNSSLPLNLIPTVKALGRGAYVLGASTLLYNELIKMAWIKYADLQYVEELIQDMDNGGVDFDENTLEMLDAMNLEGQDARGQKYGHLVAAVWSLDRFVGGWAKLERWRITITERLRSDALRNANSGKLARFARGD
ncbi:uncharacterized protein BDZ99DRAFT_68330 [Mytilinidion resinicola]|uniref:Mtf2-like C-terminal domain-containing protein n=1 Tax=Mytilinidion resinicola TaxID=574789 RepID=A0A6A6YGF9_9PEZI|nr:uncharacterized protein BDZ99DRAFT_68330 [Mytilinidion resinicola]KAF2807892.1 hypothetical protein BDZ99DRAFT_68330 [Mytilinidion resinicola]